MNQLSDGQIKRLAIITDADYEANNGMGYRKTLRHFAAIVKSSGYVLTPRKGARGGIFFAHNDGLSDLGLWVMPNNKDEGILEDWLKQCIHPNESTLLHHARNSIKTLPCRKFSTFHEVKAEIATWLAWQKIPGQGVHAACQSGLIDMNQDLFLDLADWLERIIK